MASILNQVCAGKTALISKFCETTQYVTNLILFHFIFELFTLNSSPFPPIQVDLQKVCEHERQELWHSHGNQLISQS